MSHGATARTEITGKPADRGAPPGAALVTGGGGFAGSHLVELLASEGRAPVAPSSAELDLLDPAAVLDATRAAAPAVILHLAAFSSPLRSWKQPGKALLTNIEMTLNVLEAARQAAPEASVVLVGSGQVYGEPDVMPVTEDTALQPCNPYAVSKAASDMLGAQYAAAHGVRVVRLRPFNHAGPGQSDEYVLSTLARQVAEAESEGRKATLRTGDVRAERDFTDVRDVVRAYRMAAALEPGAYNVCSGHSTSVAELIGILTREALVDVWQEDDPERMRAHDAPAMRGSHERITAACGWRPAIPLEQTVRDTLDWWRERLRPAG